MLIIGCDYHPSFQQIALVNTETGELQERRLGRTEFRTCNDCERALVGDGTSSTRAKWRALRSARARALQECLTLPTLSERRFFTSCDGCLAVGDCLLSA